MCLLEEILEFVHNAPSGGPTSRAGDDPDVALNRLAAPAFTYQYERIEPLRRLFDRRGCTPDSFSDWSDIPPVPTSAYKTFALHTAPAREIFRSSGTTRGEALRSVHHHPFPELYRATIDATFRDACLPERRPLPTLSLIPPRQALPDSSLSFMADHLLRHHAAEPKCVAIGGSGVDVAKALAWLEERARDERPGLVLSTAFALADLVEAVAESAGRLPLPAGSVVFETGGFKGRRRELSRAELGASLSQVLGVPTSAVVREYGMTELTSQAYTRVLHGGDPELFVLPPWMRVQLLDPESLEPVETGETGLVAVFDLANVGSALAVLTEDLGRAPVAGESELPAERVFRLEGRASGAELRGCSLTVEELTGGGRALDEPS